MLLAGASQTNRFAGDLDRHHTPDSILLRRPPDVHDLVLRVSLKTPRLWIGVAVTQPPVLKTLDVHPTGVEVVELGNTSVLTAADTRVGISPERERHHHLLKKFLLRLPIVWPEGQNLVERNLFRDLIATIRVATVDVEGKCAARFCQNAAAGQHDCALERGLWRDADAAVGSPLAKVLVVVEKEVFPGDASHLWRGESLLRSPDEIREDTLFAHKTKISGETGAGANSASLATPRAITSATIPSTRAGE